MVAQIKIYVGFRSFVYLENLVAILVSVLFNVQSNLHLPFLLNALLFT